MKRISKRDIKLTDHNVSNDKYNELKYFCKQYREKKDELKNSRHTTEQKAKRSELLRSDIKMIEETAKEAEESISPWLIKSVTEGVPYEWMDIPLSRTKFYDARRYFFYLLAQKR